MLRRMVLAAFAIAVSIYAAPAQSATITFITPSPVDFGSVALGDSVTQSVLFDYDLDGGLPLASYAFASPSPAFQVAGCGIGSCNVSFAPTVLGVQNGTLDVYLDYLDANEDPQRVFASIALLGTGVEATSPVPLPAALPLFASILGGAGFLTWRKRRKAASAA